MRVSPVLAGLRTYPFVKLTEAARELAASGVDVINFGIGEPDERVRLQPFQDRGQPHAANASSTS